MRIELKVKRVELLNYEMQSTKENFKITRCCRGGAFSILAMKLTVLKLGVFHHSNAYCAREQIIAEIIQAQ